jgi:hypothetical protein
MKSAVIMKFVGNVLLAGRWLSEFREAVDVPLGRSTATAMLNALNG